MYQDSVHVFSVSQPMHFHAGCLSELPAQRELPTVFVVLGEASTREWIEPAIRSDRWHLQVFESAAAFLAYPRALAPACLVLDVVLSDSCGLDLQDHLNQSDAGLPVVFVMEHQDVAVAVRAIRAGAVEVLARPVDRNALLSAIDQAIERSSAALDEYSSMTALREDYASLSRREREVMALVSSGLLNKQVAWELGISERTVKAHRGQAMRKMKARSFVHLLTQAAQLSHQH